MQFGDNKCEFVFVKKYATSQFGGSMEGPNNQCRRERGKWFYFSIVNLSKFMIFDILLFHCLLEFFKSMFMFMRFHFQFSHTQYCFTFFFLDKISLF